MRIMRKAISLMIALLMLCGCVSMLASADDANVTYTGNSGNIIFEPGSEHSPTDLFANFKNVVPGASLTQKITVTNKADNKAKVKIYLRSLGSADEKYNEFLNQMTLTVTKDTETPMFDAAADKTAGLTDWVCLGTLYSGGSLDLNVTLDVPTSMDNMFQKQIGKIKWQFVTEEYPIEEPEWDCPTGDGHSYHIDEIDGISTFVCDGCGKTEPIKCEVCGSNMHQIIYISVGGREYTAYPVENIWHYRAEDGKTDFYFNDDNVMDYYVVDGVKTDVKSVDEYVAYVYYECLRAKEHHTEPMPPHTGDDSSTALWIPFALVGGSMLVILMLRHRKRNTAEKARAKC